MNLTDMDWLKAIGVVVGVLFAGNLYWIRALHSDFTTVKKQTISNKEQLIIHQERIKNNDDNQNAHNARIQKHYDGKIDEVKSFTKELGTSLVTQINGVGANVREIKAEVTKWQETKTDIAVIKTLLGMKSPDKPPIS